MLHTPWTFPPRDLNIIWFYITFILNPDRTLFGKVQGINTWLWSNSVLYTIPKIFHVYKTTRRPLQEPCIQQSPQTITVALQPHRGNYLFQILSSSALNTVLHPMWQVISHTQTHTHSSTDSNWDLSTHRESPNWLISLQMFCSTRPRTRHSIKRHVGS